MFFKVIVLFIVIMLCILFFTLSISRKCNKNHNFDITLSKLSMSQFQIFRSSSSR
ncbi:hypothetical protein Lalb_Chr01g0010261 [Lupinus albus]|uniref:Uncharacterized protein n=1 Tax=Lupinus albus TaxID=3870 RepID=A0A6A4R4W6_LUPAL|nr:hypothetical protein Lalb_Chr01g0010261 [Lupinus albus]